MIMSPDVSASLSLTNSLSVDIDDIIASINVENTHRDARQYMISKGYNVGTQKLTKTLQGAIWCGVNTNNTHSFGGFNKNVVIKVTNKALHCDKITVLNGKTIKIQENIISEMNVLKYLTNHGISFGLNKFMVNYIDFFEDETNYYLAMEHGGSSLFEFTLKAHECILSGKLDVLEWKSVCCNIFKQMVTFIDILHNSMGVCHLDISLENILINDVMITVDHSDNDMIHFIPRFNIKFCDFGLSEIFDDKANPNYLCNKWVGKICYQSPEIYERKPNFNAKAADVWSIGVCLFLLLIGSKPYIKPSMDDATFQWIISGEISTLIELIKRWGKISYIDAGSLDILWRVFKKENKRISISDLFGHSWLH